MYWRIYLVVTKSSLIVTASTGFLLNRNLSGQLLVKYILVCLLFVTQNLQDQDFIYTFDWLNSATYILLDFNKPIF